MGYQRDLHMYIHEYIFHSNFETANGSTASAFHNNHNRTWLHVVLQPLHTHRLVDWCVCVYVFV